MQKNPSNTSIFDFHGKPPLAKALPISLQHVLAMVAGVIALIFVQWLMDRHVGGITGDTIGAAIEVTEAVMLLVAVFAATVQG